MSDKERYTVVIKKTSVYMVDVEASIDDEEDAIHAMAVDLMSMEPEAYCVDYDEYVELRPITKD